METHRTVWRALQVYLTCIAILMLVWEVVQLPLYTIWHEASAIYLVYAVLHCTAGDVSIALTALVAAILVSNREWPSIITPGMVVILVAAGVAYTVYSESVNLARGSWSYSASMPRVPGIGTGVTPALQWVALPPLALFLTRMFTRSPRHQIKLPHSTEKRHDV